MNSAKNNSYKTEEQQLKIMIINELALAFFRRNYEGGPDFIDYFVIIIGLLLFSLFVGYWIYVAYRGIKDLPRFEEKTRLMQEKILPELFSKFGKVILIEAVRLNRQIQFERNGILFELKVKVPRTAKGNELATVIQFKIPRLYEKFYIRHKSFFSPSAVDYCQLVEVMMSDDFIFYSLNPQFLVNLIAKHNIRDEIYKYKKKSCHKFEVVCDDGAFAITWHRFRSKDKSKNLWEMDESPEDETRKLEQICQTAFVFCDELTKTTT